MSRPGPLPPALVERPFAVAEGRALGLTPGRLRGNDLARPFRGIRAREAPRTHLESCRAYSAKLRPGEHFSHASAAHIHGMSLPWRLRDGPVNVTAVLPLGRPRGAGVIGHSMTPSLARVVTVAGLRVSHPVEAWCELATTLTHAELVAVGDALVRRQGALATMDELAAAVHRRRGRRGYRLLTTALPVVRAGTDSWEETMLRLDLAAAGLPEPEVNGAIRTESGALIAIGDLVFRRYRVLAEYDGEQHRTDGAQYNRDVDRLDDLARRGWRTIRFTRLHRGNLRAERLERVRAALIARGWRPE